MSNLSSLSASLIDMRLTAVLYAAEGTNIYELRRPEGGSVAPFTAGAHIDVHLPNGLIRQYSILNAQSDTERYLIAVKRDPASRGGSASMHEELRVGAILPISKPRNHFPLVEGGAPVVLIAGGIGVTPLWSMAQRASAIGLDWRLHYAVRNRAEAALLNDMAGHGDRVRLHEDNVAGGPIDLAGIIAGAAPEAHLYCCGPGPMLDAFEAACAAAGIAPDHVHVERFSAPPPAATTQGFVVELARSGIELTVAPGETILECARKAGLPVEASCEQGICGACETRVLAGVPDHLDMILNDAERASNATMMICCSGSRTERLKLDL
ncbi:PDR/VanB family oxidoreductase [Sphingomonas sp.]|uniref:PDR/VanB family oxidoreductase n=1 Tax=Sphingomonas sp. TaxID=28214 RepID=UPI0025D7A432|nr:PDR/VanB family oxidoreductase [Sphingomonas sp.]